MLPRNEWKWKSFFKGSSVHYLYHTRTFTVLTINKEPNPDYDYTEDFMIDEYYCHHSSRFNVIAAMFGEENLEICFKVFIKWVEKNVPFSPDKSYVLLS